MKNQELEQLLTAEMENIQGGALSQDTCICENGGAASIVVVDPEITDHPILTV